MARMEREMASLTADFKTLEASYGDDVLHLVIASGYLSRLVANSAIEQWLAAHKHTEERIRATIESGVQSPLIDIIRTFRLTY